MSKKIGEQSVKFENPIYIKATASIAGHKEGEGPLKEYFDEVLPDSLDGEKTWEKAESRMIKKSLDLVVKKSGLSMNDIDYIISGDLLNQSISSTFGIRDTNRPFFGIFGACSTMGESMMLGSMLLDGGFGKYILANASSHFCAAEKQFRLPLNMGTQRPPTSTWTVTGAGSAVLSVNGSGPIITHATTGKIVDMGITDPSNMGAAMAPSAVDTLITHFRDLGREPSYYDLIITGDLGYIGHELVIKLAKEEGFDLSENYSDCGIKIFDKHTQDTHSGGSGCGCAALTFAGFLYSKLVNKEYKRILFVPTGALMSPISSQQGESIPGIAHALCIENL